MKKYGCVPERSAKYNKNQLEDKMSDITNSYKCKACGAPLRWDAEQEILVCDHCDSKYSPDAFEIEEKGDKDANFDWSDFKEGDRETIDNTKTYKCSNCGAEIVTDMTTVASKCPYCDNVLVMEPELKGALKPNAIIPFTVDHKELLEIVKGFYKGKHLLPNNFLDESKIMEIQGIYVPFWLFDTLADGYMQYQGTKTRSWSDKKYDYVETKYYDVYREGSMRFSKVPVDGSVKMDNALMDSIEPYDYSKLIDFNPAYFSGFLADRFDEGVKDSLPRATRRIRQSVSDEFSKTATQYDSLTEKGGSLKMLDTSVKYALLPVYLIHSAYGGKDYHYAVNGQTGKIVGNLPISKVKQALYFLAFTAGGTFVSSIILAVVAVLLL